LWINSVFQGSVNLLFSIIAGIFPITKGEQTMNRLIAWIRKVAMFLLSSPIIILYLAFPAGIVALILEIAIDVPFWNAFVILMLVFAGPLGWILGLIWWLLPWGLPA
jgi:hypothetical protein